jgi:hypothetical protein
MGSDVAGDDVRQRAGVRRERGMFVRTVVCYAIVCAIFGGIGYWLAREPIAVTNLYFAREPKSPPDLDLQFSALSTDVKQVLVTQDVARISERYPDGRVHNIYYAPKRPDHWGTVEMEFRWDPEFQPAMAILEPNLHLFGQFDKTAAGEIAISSEATGNRWVTLASLGNSEVHVSLGYPGSSEAFLKKIDMTRWVQGSHALRIRYRLKANRLMYHPTPDDPIGLAAAQCLRQSMDGFASRLRLWRNVPDSD